MGLLNIKLDEILYIKCLLSATPPPHKGSVYAGFYYYNSEHPQLNDGVFQRGRCQHERLSLRAERGFWDLRAANGGLKTCSVYRKSWQEQGRQRRSKHHLELSPCTEPFLRARPCVLFVDELTEPS